ncbi:ABC transporter permease [Oceanithermus desulfurans]|uniref:Peptide ABC transporter permease n=2 Tax=Oceanithermus desulfurans TaxID=227924 RepID=A0A511RMK1_9DEIN|nr:ABC transporter permease [Oceanithermus desulfurans]MBB6030564.1 peptide/nickel transport system permease protein [Oceanithermus desulfurans]GEM90026.1 peptide ABC transporter permease [Oceanithermus desulfurans NBRC 100063]
MTTFIVRRLLQLPIVLLAISLLIFGMMQFLTPEQRAATYAKSEQQAKNLDLIIRQYNLDQGFLVQYSTWLKQVLRGNLGYSKQSHEPVVTTIRKRLPVSAELALYMFFPTLLFGVWMGTMAAIHRDRFVDQAVRVFAIIGWSLPTFVLAIWMLAVFYGYFKLFGIGRADDRIMVEFAKGTLKAYTGMITIDGILNGRWDVTLSALKRLVMPVATYTIVASAQIMRVLRSSMLDVLNSDYVRTARAKGLPERVVNLKHARRNAIIPVVTIAGLMFAFMLEGVFFIEIIFNIPGLGQWAVPAAIQLDFPAVIGIALLTGLVVSIANLAVDILYGIIDPRISFQ